ncbi:MAG TPA: tetratricopeptide repeat protein, partial [Chthoniobacterales bacterium]
YFHRRLGRWEESTKELEQAVDLDPRNANTLQELASNYHALHNYAAYIGTLERVISISPQSISPRIFRAHADLWWYGNTKPLRTLVDSLVQEDAANSKELVHTNLMLCFYERDLDGIARALALLGESWYGNDHMKLSRAFGEGMLARMRGDAAAAHAHFTRARAQQQRVVESQPGYAPALSVLGLVDAALGRKEDALRAGQRAVELLPRTKDSMAGPAMICNLAIIAGFVGADDLALEQLRSLLDKPAGPQYGHLKLDPMFDPLRSDPRFAELVASVAAKHN